MNSVKYPDMRGNLFSFVNALADIDFQHQHWGTITESGSYVNLDMVVHFLLDDMELNKNPETAVGIVLVDQEEAIACFELTIALEKLFAKYGWDQLKALNDMHYICRTEWSEVVSCAKTLIEILNRNGGNPFVGRKTRKKGDAAQ